MKEYEQIKHHSTSDWNFSTTYWTLDTVNFVSSPSSLKITSWNQGIVLKHAISGVIPEGRIVDQLRFYRGRTTNIYGTFIFRFQPPDGVWVPASLYKLGLHGSTNLYDADLDRATLECWNVGNKILTTTSILNPTLPQNTWHKLRLTWWVSAGVLIVRLEYWNGAEWVKMFDDCTDPANMFAASATNRIGVGPCGLYTTTNTWHDDTEVWVKA